MSLLNSLIDNAWIFALAALALAFCFWYFTDPVYAKMTLRRLFTFKRRRRCKIKWKNIRVLTNSGWPAGCFRVEISIHSTRRHRIEVVNTFPEDPSPSGLMSLANVLERLPNETEAYPLYRQLFSQLFSIDFVWSQVENIDQQLEDSPAPISLLELFREIKQETALTRQRLLEKALAEDSGSDSKVPPPFMEVVA